MQGNTPGPFAVEDDTLGGWGDEYSFFGPTGADMWAASDVGWWGPDTSWMWDGSQGFDYFDPAPGLADLWYASGFTDADIYGLADNPYWYGAGQEVLAHQEHVFDVANADWDWYFG